MENPIFDFLRSALIPILGPNIAAGPSGHIHFALIPVAALGAFPNQLSVIFLDLDFAVEAAYLAVVRLGIQFRVHDVLIDELHDFQNRINVALHVRDFHIADSASGRQLLELSFKGELLEGIDLFGHMDMIGVGNIVLVRNARNNTESLLQALCKLIRR